MTDTADATVAEPGKSRIGRLMPLLVPVLALGAGAASTYMGFWSPLALISSAETPAEAHVTGPEIAFVDVPRIVLTVPGERPRRSP